MTCFVLCKVLPCILGIGVAGQYFFKEELFCDLLAFYLGLEFRFYNEASHQLCHVSVNDWL
jgi:hypothetical protein